MSWSDLADWREWGGRSRGFAAVILAALVLLLGWFVLLQGRYGTYQSNSTLAQTLKQTLAGKAHARSQRGSAHAALNDAAHQLHDARWRLSAGVGMSELLDELAGSGHAHGLVFEQLDVEPARPETGYQVVPLQVIARGRYPALRLWLDEWLGQVRLLRVTSLRLDGDSGHPGMLRLQLRVDSHDPGEDLAAPASLAHEPARPAPRPPRVDLFAPWPMGKARAGLAGVPLVHLEMVGSLSQDGRHQALLWSAGRVYRVSVGDRLGRNGGVVAMIDRQQVEVRERVFVAGVWHERSAYLAIRKRMDNEVMDDTEQSENGADGDAAVESVRSGDALSG